MHGEQGHITWYTRRDGITRGPFSPENITRYLLLGRIRLDDEISHDGKHWSRASSSGEFLPAELANLSSWEDYQQLLVARMQADERTAERRIQNSDDWLMRHSERRNRADRRQRDNTLPVSQHRFSDTPSPAAVKSRGPGALGVLISLLLVVLVFAFLLPAGT